MYLICEKCGKYYKIRGGESPKDFNVCNCGCNLKYVKYIKNVSNNQKNFIDYNVVSHIQEYKTILRSKWRTIFRSKLINDQSQKVHNNRSKYDYQYVLDQGREKGFFDRIDWAGVQYGILFYIGALIFSKIILWSISLAAIQNSNVAGLLPFLSVLGFIFSFIPLASGFIAVYVITTRDYLIGLINGGMVGVVIAIVLGIISLTYGLLMAGFSGQLNIGITSIFAGLIPSIISGGISTAVGGLIAVLVRRYTSII